jgi:hypothetical protein
MRTPRPFLFLLILPILPLLTGASSTEKERWPDRTVPPSVSDLAATSADAEAEQLLDRAVAAVDPERTPWLETSFRQRVRLPGLEYEADGDYRIGPGQCFRLEVRTRIGRTPGTLVLVGDGRHLWRGTRLGEGPWTEVTRAPFRNGGMVPTLDGLNFSGVAPLLRHLRERMIWVRHEAAGGRVTLTGVWPEEARRRIAPKAGTWPVGLPSCCRLTLAADGWPHRVEWWGPRTEGGGTELLVEMEFRDAVRNRALSSYQTVAVFSFDPGPTTVVDRADDGN